MMGLITALILASPHPGPMPHGQEVVVTAGPYKGCHGIVVEEFRYYFQRKPEYFGLDMVHCANGPEYIDYFVHESDLRLISKDGEER